MIVCSSNPKHCVPPGVAWLVYRPLLALLLLLVAALPHAAPLLRLWWRGRDLYRP